MSEPAEHPRITYDEFLAMLRDPDVSDAEIRPYVRVERNAGDAFNPVIRPNGELVEMTEADLAAENAMGIGNHAARARRKLKFVFSRKERVLVSEGDSWFQFPILVEDVIDHLDDDYRILSLGAAGDTADNMVFASREYVSALRDHRDSVKAFLFSGAGNDIIGEDEDGEPTLKKLLKASNSNRAEDYIDEVAVDTVMEFLQRAYEQVIVDVRAIPQLQRLPILIHGYDYPFPYPANGDDPRDPIYAGKDQWLGKPFTEVGIDGASLRRDIIKMLIDQLYDLLHSLAATHADVHVVDVRGTLGDVEDWVDEIHATDDGFELVAAKFAAKLDEVMT